MLTEEEWAAERIVARIWWCGDEVCDCACPQIEKITPNYVAGYPWTRREVLWSGTFVSRGYGLDDGVDLEAELRAECAVRGLPAP
jgi:hypothetical protein